MNTRLSPYRPRPYARRPVLFTVAALGLVLASGAACAGAHSTTVTVTAYNGVRNQTDDTPTTGAWSNRLSGWAVAVSPDLVARGLDDGTEIAIEGYEKHFVVKDKTAADRHKTVDIYMGKDTNRARDFGQKTRRIWWYSGN